MRYYAITRVFVIWILFANRTFKFDRFFYETGQQNVEGMTEYLMQIQHAFAHIGTCYEMLSHC